MGRHNLQMPVNLAKIHEFFDSNSKLRNAPLHTVDRPANDFISGLTGSLIQREASVLLPLLS
jgi:hypothetical protein